jgi:hypothetical protein
MAQLPAVSDTLRASLTSRRSRTYSSHFTRRTRRQSRDRHSPHRHHTRRIAQLPAVSDTEGSLNVMKIANILIASYSQSYSPLGS